MNDTINQIGAKLVSLQYLTLREITNSSVILWKSVESIIKKNNGVLDIDIGSIGSNIDIHSIETLADAVVNYIVENEIKIHTFTISARANTYQMYKKFLKCDKDVSVSKTFIASAEKVIGDIEKLIVIPQNELKMTEYFSWTFLNPYDFDTPSYEYILDLKYKFKSLKMIEMNLKFFRWNIRNVVEFFNNARDYNNNYDCIDGIKQYSNIFFDICIDVRFDASEQDFKDNLLLFFKIIDKMIQDGVSFNVDIKFAKEFDWIHRVVAKRLKEKNAVKDRYGPDFNHLYDTLFEPTLGKYLKTNKTTNLKQDTKTPLAKCNNLCRAVSVPMIDFGLHNETKSTDSFNCCVGYFKAQTAISL